MKKRIIVSFAVLLLSVVMAFCAPGDPVPTSTEQDDPLAFYLLGSVRAKAAISVTMFEEVFPFDLDSAEVSYNSSTDIVYGLRIGEYTMVSNSSSTTLYITHNPLILEGTDGSDANGRHRKIDYRLYVMVNFNVENEGPVVFKSCVSDSNATTPASAANAIVLSGVLRLVNKSLYVSLDEGSQEATEAIIEDLAEGTYKSNIYFLLEGN